jgi:hypothetical protein
MNGTEVNMQRFRVVYKVGQSEREVNLEAESLEDAEKKAEARNLKWVDIYNRKGA